MKIKLASVALLVLTLLVLFLIGPTFGQTQHGITLTWVLSTAPNVSGQNVYECPVVSPATQCAIGVSTLNLLTSTPLAPTVTTYFVPKEDGKTYSYVLTAIQNGVESIYSNEATVTALGPQPNPQTGLAAKVQ